MTGLLALMVLTQARAPARTGADGALIPLDEQDRALWDRTAVAEGIALAEKALSQGPAGDYQLQAAIAALHDEAERAEDTDWPQILALYDLLVRRTPDPAAALGRAVAVAMVHGPRPTWRRSTRWRRRRGPRTRPGGRRRRRRGTTGSTPYAPISWNGPGTRPPPVPPTARPPTPPSASPRPAISEGARTSWTDSGSPAATAAPRLKHHLRRRSPSPRQPQQPPSLTPGGRRTRPPRAPYAGPSPCRTRRRP